MLEYIILFHIVARLILMAGPDKQLEKLQAI
jgi:hypothetical protein